MHEDSRIDQTLPTAYPPARFPDEKRGAAYVAALEQADAVNRRLGRALVKTFGECGKEVTTTGELAELLAKLEPDTPLVMNDRIEVQGDGWDMPGGRWHQAIVADDGGSTIVPSGIRDDTGQQYNVSRPALALSLRWLRQGEEPDSGAQEPVHPCDQLAAADSTGPALLAAAAVIDGIVKELDGEPGPAADEIAAAVRNLRAEAERLRDAAGIAFAEEEED